MNDSNHNLHSNVKACGIYLTDHAHNPEILEPLYTILNNIFIPPSTIFIENKLINDLGTDELSKFIPIELAKFIIFHLAQLNRRLNIEPNSDIGGWEVWTRISTENSPSFGYLHVDNDEYLRSKTGLLSCPKYGSIFYVGNSNGFKGGETAFLTNNKSKINSRLFSVLENREFSNHDFTFIKPKPNRLVIFEGNIPHAIMKAKFIENKPRITLLANFWERRISSVPIGITNIIL